MRCSLFGQASERSLHMLLGSTWLRLCALGLLCVLTTQTAYGAWYDTQWLHRQKVTLADSVTDADLADFPYLISISDSTNGLFTHAQSDGDDILFTAADGSTKLDHEIESYSTSPAELVAWVRIPTLATSANTEIYMYYGHDTVSTQQTPTAVWDSTFAGVWHLDEDSAGVGTADLYQDAGANTSHGLDSVSATGQEGQIDGGQQFDGTDDFVDLDSHAATYASLTEGTLSLWFRYTDRSDYKILFSASCNTDDNSDIDILYYQPDDVFMWGIREDGTNVVNCSFPGHYADSNWHYYAMTVSTSGNEHYIDGSRISCAYTYGGDSTTQAFFDAVADLNTVRFGNREDFNGGQYYYNGNLDEVRIASIARSADWISATYRNQSTPGTYQAMAAPESNHLILVTTAVDSLDGDTSSIQALHGDMGTDSLVSLREAIIACNNTAGLDSVTFAIGSGLQTIQLNSALPVISDSIVVDGSTQPGYSGDPLIELDGNSAGAGVDGLSFTGTSDGSTARGLVIKRCSRDGVLIQAGADSITVAGCWIGVDTSGATSMGNGDDGIEIFANYATIGGTGGNDGNVINNSNDEGINITGSATGNLIIGNIIGLNPDGITGSGNDDVGIAILPGTSANTIGGVTAAHRNIISMNVEGIEINTADNAVLGNYIGTDTSGTLDKGNQTDDGVELQSGNAVRNRIGDTLTGAGNLIAFNARNGVNLVGGSRNSVLGNRIHSNDLRGIDIDNNGATPNDSADVDGGPNFRQNYPKLDSAITNGTDTLWVYGTLNSFINADFLVECFTDSVADPSSYGEGATYLGNTFVTTDGAGDGSFSDTILAAVTVGQVISTTATDSLGNSSEFSDTALVRWPGSLLSVAVGNPTFSFGVNPANTWLTAQTSVLTNDGTLTENLAGRISQLTDGSNTWDISATVNGADSVRAQWSTVSGTGPWSDISAYDTDFNIATSMAPSDSVTLWFRILTPVTTSSFSQHASTLTVIAR